MDRDDGLTPHDWLTQRAAAQVLHEDLGIHPERTAPARRRADRPAAGTSLACFHRRDRVDAFVEAQRSRPPIPVPDRNLVIVRVGNGRVRFGSTEQHQLDRLSEGWRMSSTWRVLCRAVLDVGAHPVGFLVTLGGYVVSGADILGAEWMGNDIEGADHDSVSPLLTRFDLRPPGEWYEAWRGRLLPTSAGGAALRVWPLGWPAPWDRAQRSLG
ncbi:hypothetical protein [Nocardioides sp.]|uniref:hypothetical protein n=1 Tax=Nocardioides sp. TaxID=35761 RepID=UPI0035B446A4